MKEQNPTRKDESIKTDNEICEMCAKESEEPENNIAQEENGCCCYRRTTARSQDERKKLMNRLSRIEETDSAASRGCLKKMPTATIS